jgi:hypothetical protein
VGKRLYVGNLSYNVSSADLEQLFSQYGRVTSAQVVQDRDTGRSKGFGFVEMGTDQEALASKPVRVKSAVVAAAVAVVVATVVAAAAVVAAATVAAVVVAADAAAGPVNSG